ncbi:L,D-transpeptidase [Faunimonas sp. B44]|uniref:L,D-transpeptidase n=1 Tax=Faunimonas sp. B44 TaxID=3461493 RepID=UPI004044149B
MIARRAFLLAGAAGLISACTPIGRAARQPVARNQLLVPATNEPHRVAPVDLSQIPPQFHRQIVANATGEPPGTLVVDPGARFLYLVMPNGEAMRYGVGVGREGFAWSGVARVGRKAKWPRWTPPAAMQRRDPFAAKWAGGMPGGPQNPLGARALYLYRNGRDTLYRIHGTPEPHSIGRAVSSGCIRLLNADIIDLYDRVPIGARVVVRRAEGGFDGLVARLKETVGI